ncbi:arylamine N-acetyltransferase [Aquimarina aquimarini]|uniref:arylamine N-acetyltransferase n=2 Tax=Aquimarina aquimarini TaxID=1191734 RepID=UPI00131F1985|nr:arylamine N-acetyltransferase [Aquimarina aquimarini]
MNPEIGLRVLKKLELSEKIEPTLENLQMIYLQWCRNVPFDNFWKRLHLNNNRFSEQKQINANVFFDIWLTHGLGGTCWVTSNALFHLLKFLGYNIHFITGSMGDIEGTNHGSIIVLLNKKQYMVDTSMLNEEPISLKEKKNSSHSLHPINILLSGGEMSLLFELCNSKNKMTWTITSNEVGFDKIEHLNQISMITSLFNDCVYIRKNSKDAIYSIIGNTFYIKTADKTAQEVLGNKEIEKKLKEVMGFSEEIVEHISKTYLFAIPEQSALLELTKL